MSVEMRDFAAAFNKGLDRGVGMAQKREDQAIQREHNKLLQDQHQATERHQTRRDDIYAESVKNAGELSRARAQAALNKGAGKGGGVAAHAPNPDKYAEGAAGVGLAIPKPQAPPAPTIINQTDQSTSDDADPGPIPPPAMRKGGMVKKYADGGMTVQEALSYGPRTGGSESKPKETAASSFESNFKKAAEAAAARKPSGTIKNAAPKPTGPVGTGPAGSYTTADVQPGGVLDTTSAGISGTDYRRGGKVRKFAGGGAADLSDPEAAVKSMAYTPADKNPDGSNKTKDQEDGTIARTSRAVSSGSGIDFSAFAGGSADGATGGESGSGASAGGPGGGVSESGGSGGVGGNAGVAGEGADSGTGGTYRRGGRVRRFQSGGRVMEAIDTGTSGPGSGYGYRAAPPARRY